MHIIKFTIDASLLCIHLRIIDALFSDKNFKKQLEYKSVYFVIEKGFMGVQC